MISHLMRKCWRRLHWELEKQCEQGMEKVIKLAKLVISLIGQFPLPSCTFG
jgi:hypothetical protein